MVAVDEHEGDRTRDGCCLLLQLGGRRERIPSTGHEEAGQMQLGEVGGSEPIGPSRRMERIADQDEGCGVKPLGDGHRAHPSPHGTTAERQPPRRHIESSSQGDRGGADCLDAHFGWIGSAFASGLAWELDALDRDARVGDHMVHRQQPGMIPSCAAARRENEASWARSGH